MINPTAKAVRGMVFVRSEVCKGCSYCIDFCPSHCLEFSREFNAKGYHYPVMAHPENCSGCDMCGSYCPDFAISGARTKDIENRKRIIPTVVNSAPQELVSTAK